MLLPAVHMDKPGCLISCQPGKNTSCAFSSKLIREIEPNPVPTIGSYDLSAKFGGGSSAPNQNQHMLNAGQTLDHQSRWFLTSEKIQKKIKVKSAPKRVEIALFIAPKPVQCLCKWFDFVRSEISLR